MDQKGYACKVVPVKHLGDLREAVEGRHARGLFDEVLYEEYLAHFAYECPEALPEARSLIVTAVPQPQINVTFTWQGEARKVMIPPTYLHAPNKLVEAILVDVLGPNGYRVAPTALPVKTLAVRSGLGEYGRNNICYVPGMGSFHRLIAFCSDFPPPEDSWREPQAMEICQKCEACLRNCPTAAIVADRFLIRADRCLTFHNERPAEFPDWIDPAWHHCLVGCLRCQSVCPQNARFVKWTEEGPSFSEEETSLILSQESSARLPRETAEKLKRIDMIEYVEILSRNLGVLLKNPRSNKKAAQQ
jgi:epoxyqueuosine reductase